MEPGERAGMVEARRGETDVERFLDLVGFLASNSAAFLLDPTYRGMLSASEQDLVGQLTPLIRRRAS